MELNIQFHDVNNVVDKLGSLQRYLENIPFVAAEGRLYDMGDKLIDYIIEIIDSSRKRPDNGSHVLENAWLGNIEELINDPGKRLVIGIGKISKLKELAPYWEVLNDGGYIPPANMGYFGDNFRAPEAGGAGEDWKHTGKGSNFHFMRPSKAIEGIDYIGKSIRQFNKDLKKEVQELGGIWIDGMKKSMQ